MSEQKGSGKTAGHIPAETHEERQERSFKAAAHNPSNTHEGRWVIVFYSYSISIQFTNTLIS